MRRLQGVEAASEVSWHAPAYGGDAVWARGHRRALPVVATVLPSLRRHGAEAPVWHRFGLDGRRALADAPCRSVGDCGSFDVGKEITCLVGEKECGGDVPAAGVVPPRPVEDAGFDKVVVFPARRNRGRRQLPVGRMVPAVGAAVVVVWVMCAAVSVDKERCGAADSSEHGCGHASWGVAARGCGGTDTCQSRRLPWTDGS